MVDVQKWRFCLEGQKFGFAAGYDQVGHFFSHDRQ